VHPKSCPLPSTTQGHILAAIVTDLQESRSDCEMLIQHKATLHNTLGQGCRAMNHDPFGHRSDTMNLAGSRIILPSYAGLSCGCVMDAGPACPTACLPDALPDCLPETAPTGDGHFSQCFELPPFLLPLRKQCSPRWDEARMSQDKPLVTLRVVLTCAFVSDFVT
jgi:hypothetical protein